MKKKKKGYWDIAGFVDLKAHLGQGCIVDVDMQPGTLSLDLA